MGDGQCNYIRDGWLVDERSARGKKNRSKENSENKDRRQKKEERENRKKRKMARRRVGNKSRYEIEREREK